MTNELLYGKPGRNRIWNIHSVQTVSFSICYAPNLWDAKSTGLVDLLGEGRVLSVVDEHVLERFGSQINAYFIAQDRQPEILPLAASEENKSFGQLDRILNWFESLGVFRREVVVGIGGGVLLDLVGFAAAIYRRGIPYLRIPTTLLGMVDVSVASKVGINHFGRRNRLGAYYPPMASLIDRRFLATQTARQLSNGLGEILKIALIKNSELFGLLERHAELLHKEKFQEGAVPVRILNLAIESMVQEISTNLWENDLARSVDFGHTFSPLIEMNNVSEMLHGEAVALDCLLTSCISYIRGILSENELLRVFETVRMLRLPTLHSDFLDVSVLGQALRDTVAHRNGLQNTPIPITIGNYGFLNDISESDLMSATKVMRDFA